MGGKAWSTKKQDQTNAEFEQAYRQYLLMRNYDNDYYRQLFEGITRKDEQPAQKKPAAPLGGMTSRSSSDSGPDFLTGAVIGMAVSGAFSDSGSSCSCDSGSSFDSGGGTFGGGGSDSSW